MIYMYHCSHSYNRNMAPFIVRSHDHVAYHTDRKLQSHPYHRAHTYKCTRCICIFSYIYPIYPICGYTDLTLVLSSCHTVNIHMLTLTETLSLRLQYHWLHTDGII